MLEAKHRSSLGLIAAIVIILMLASVPGFLVPGYAHAAPAEQQVGAEISQPTPAIRSGESVRCSVTVSLTAPAEYLEVRLRLRTPEGRLIYQKTEVRSEVAQGRHVVTFERPEDNPALSQGRYPVEVRVLATGSEPTNASGRVLVLDPETARQKVAIVARMWATPNVDGDGLFIKDPATQPSMHDDLSLIAGLATSKHVPISLIAPPVLFEELGRVAEGYQVADDEQPVPADSKTPAAAAKTLELLVSARQSGLLTLADTAYALPDLAGLAAIDAQSDLGIHWTRGDAVLMATLRSTTASSVAYLGFAPTGEAITLLSARGSERLIVPERSSGTDSVERLGGVRPLGDTGIIAIIPDEDASAAVNLGPMEFYDVMFDRLETGPITLVMDIGTDAGQRPIDIERAVEMIGRASWLELASLDSFEPSEEARAVLLPPEMTSTAPHSHWDAVADAREALLAYGESTGAGDPDVDSLSRTLLVVESELWAGADGTWEHSEQARKMAEGVSAFVTSEFEKITFDAKDVTLSGSTGEVPFTLVNNTGKHLTLTVVSSFDGDHDAQTTQVIEIDPVQNLITVPVDMRNSMESELRVMLVSGTRTVAETTLTVRTSYIDRLATVGMVVVILLVMLMVIRRRVVPPNAGTIGKEDNGVRNGLPDDEQRV